MTTANVAGPLVQFEGARTRQTISVGPQDYTYYSLATAEALGLAGIARLPFSLKVLLENLLRQHAEGRSDGSDIDALHEIGRAHV